MDNLFINILAAVFIPALIITRIGFSPKAASRPKRLSVAILGIVLVFPASFLESLYGELSALAFPQGEALPKAIDLLNAPLIEEALKLVLLSSILTRNASQGSLKEPSYLLGILLGTGFALGENLFFLTESTLSIALRAITTLPLHLSLALITSQILGKRGFPPALLRSICALTMTIGVHSIFNSLSVFNLSILTPFLSILLMGMAFLFAFRKDQA